MTNHGIHVLRIDYELIGRVLAAKRALAAMESTYWVDDAVGNADAPEQPDPTRPHIQEQG